MRSFLVLGDGSRLMLDTLAGLDFTGIDLVTLSACQTAMSGGQTDDGREIEGLSTIVQQRGARQVVASLWRVEDESTAQLMRGMYGALAAHGTDVARRPATAQRSLRAQASADDSLRASLLLGWLRRLRTRAAARGRPGLSIAVSSRNEVIHERYRIRRTDTCNIVPARRNAQRRRAGARCAAVIAHGHRRAVGPERDDIGRRREG